MLMYAQHTASRSGTYLGQARSVRSKLLLPPISRSRDCLSVPRAVASASMLTKEDVEKYERDGKRVAEHTHT